MVTLSCVHKLLCPYTSRKNIVRFTKARDKFSNYTASLSLQYKTGLKHVLLTTLVLEKKGRNDKNNLMDFYSVTSSSDFPRGHINLQ